MFLDQRRAWLEQVRYALSAAAYPVQLAVSSPAQAWSFMQESLATREALRAQNAQLREHERVLELRSLRYEALVHENDELRGLRDALPPVADRWLAAEVVSVELDNLRPQRLLINRGARNGVFKGQVVLDRDGVVGQTLHVGPWSTEIILITDTEHDVPVQIQRTGVRTIAVGAGDSESLALPYLPANADVRPGDLLVTSGLGGVFPQGYPVARITDVRRDAVQPLALIRAVPLAHMDRVREVTLVWFRADHPAAPVAEGSDPHGNPAMQPQAAPPRPAPAVAAAQVPGRPAAGPPAAGPPAAGPPAAGSPAAQPAAATPHAAGPAGPVPHAPASAAAAPHAAGSHAAPSRTLAPAAAPGAAAQGGGE